MIHRIMLKNDHVFRLFLPITMIAFPGLASASTAQTPVIPRLCFQLIASINGSGHPDVTFHNPNNRRHQNRSVDIDAHEQYRRISRELEAENPPVALPGTLDSFGPLLAFWAKLINPYDVETSLRVIHQKITSRTGDIKEETIHRWMVGTSNPRVEIQSTILSAFEDHYRSLRRISIDDQELYPRVVKIFSVMASARPRDITDVVRLIDEHMGAKRAAEILEVPFFTYKKYVERVGILQSPKARLQEFAINFRFEQVANLGEFLLTLDGIREIQAHIPPYVAPKRVVTARPKRPVTLGSVNDDLIFELLPRAERPQPAIYDVDKLIDLIADQLTERAQQNRLRQAIKDRSLGVLTEEQILDRLVKSVDVETGLVNLDSFLVQLQAGASPKTTP